jgi:hypothetical protein
MDEIAFPYEQGMIPLNETVNLTQHAAEGTIRNIVWSIVAILFLLSVLMIVVIWLRRTLFIKQNQNHTFLKNRYETLLAEFVAGEYEEEIVRERSAEKETKLSLDFNELTNPINRKIFKKQLILLRKSMSGLEASRLRELYLMLGFKNEAIHLLKNSQKEHVLIKSLTELTLMHIQEAGNLAIPFTSHRNPMVSVCAMRAVMRFQPDGKQLDFLNTLKFELTHWQQTHLFAELQHQSAAALPNFARWRHHPQASIRAFADKMSEHFGSSDFFSDESEDVLPSQVIDNQPNKTYNVYGQMDIIMRPIL